MSPSWQAPVVLMVLVTWLTVPPAGLAEAARLEALRRALAGPSIGSFTNDELPPAPPPPAVSGLPAPAPKPERVAEQRPEAVPAEPRRDEQWWRNRVAAARSSLERNQLLADSVQSRINALQTDVVNIDDPAQQALARQNLGRAMGELERLQQLIEANQQEIAQIQDDARRQRVPPGWVR